MSNGPELIIFYASPGRGVCSGSIASPGPLSLPRGARLSSQFLRKLQPGIMNHISRRAAAGTNADAGLVHHRERKMALHHSPWNQGGPVLHDDCQRRMQAFKSDF